MTWSVAFRLRRYLRESLWVGASLIGAGMISVLVYPFIATRLVSQTATGPTSAPARLPGDEY